MLVFGSQMHVVTFILVILELMMYSFQLVYYYFRPVDKPRLYYLILLKLLIFYNLSTGLYPDPGLPFPSIVQQNIIAFGCSFLIGAYFPYYFYRRFKLDRLRWHAIHGALWFLLLPYVCFFGILYPATGKLDVALNYGLILPFGYSGYLLHVIWRAIKVKFSARRGIGYLPDHKEAKWAYLAVCPWLCLPVFAYFKVSQLTEVLVANLGFVWLTVWMMLHSIAAARVEHERINAVLNSRAAEFRRRCAFFELTSQEIRVANLVCMGLSYAQIADSICLSIKTVDTHIQHIFLKTGVNRKVDLMQKLGFLEEYADPKKSSFL